MTDKPERPPGWPDEKWAECRRYRLALSTILMLEMSTEFTWQQQLAWRIQRIWRTFWR